MRVNEVREKYLKFFERRGHKIIPPAPLILENDPTTLFTSSGMQPLVPYLMGEEYPGGFKRLVDSQPSLRAHGLSDDVNEVGDNRHTTFFEMLGNWSLGDYFKKEQLPWIFEFLTSKKEGLGLDPKRIYVSVFEGDGQISFDEESYEIWRSLGVSENHIHKYGVKKNWWSRSGTPEQMPVGEIGGPDSEIFYDFGEELGLHTKSQWRREKCHPNCDCGRFMEIGNSVFMQYRKTENGLTELPQKNVDFGGGLERLTAATNNNPDVFRIDVFSEIIQKIEKITDKKYEGNEPSMRIIADHIRAANALGEGGVIPSNKLQGYVMRRLIRRAVVKFKNLKEDVGVSDFEKLTDNKNILDEVSKFERTLDKGLKEFNKLEEIDGKIAFDLYQTYGFPLEITLELAAQEKGQKIDMDQFRKAFEEHKDKSRTASAGVFKGGLADHSIEVTRLHTVHHLVLAALQKIVDKRIVQKGSNINSERMRMDFNFDRKLTDEEIKRIEDLVNEKIGEDLTVTKKIMSKEEAGKIGAQMEFAKKYPENVSVYFIGLTDKPFSVEFCGGPHVNSLAEINGVVKIVKQESVSSGMRRIYAVIG